MIKNLLNKVAVPAASISALVAVVGAGVKF